MIANSQRWQKTAVAIAAVALLGVSAPSAWALSLGRVTVLSALGEPLRAEIDIPSINADEAASLKAAVATPEAFVAAGLDYNPAMTSLRATLQQRPDGRAYLRLSSDRAINDPFVDMILEASWSSGRIVRDYTMLFDPPAFRKPSAAQAPTLPQIAAPMEPMVPMAPPKPSAAAPVSRPAAAAKPAPASAAAPVPSAPKTATPSANKNVVVKLGDTAGKIAATHKPQGVSLDQMLVALLRANPEVFVNDNINRIRTGAVMNLPTAQEAQVVPPAEATQIILAQSKDFNTFRRNLASNVTAAPVGNADRKASGTIEAKVDDKKGSAVTPDKLTLSKGSVQSKAEDTQIANNLAAKEAAQRAKEIQSNINALNQIGTATTAAAALPATPASATPAIAVPVAVPELVASAPVVAASSPVPEVSAPLPVAAPVAAASAPAQTASAPLEPAVAALPEPEASTGLLETLQENPAIPGVLAGLLALLGGFAAFKYRQRKKKTKSEGEVLESRLQPDSFFGSSGGQRVDTNDADGFKPSSILFSASQLESGDDVDPVAEADVYLAYGRDAQAEEILKEALRTNPTRLAIRTKLLEILAKRRDVKGFESAASQALVLTTKNSTDWNRICEMGLGIDPHNPLYQPDGAQAAPVSDKAATAAAEDFAGLSLPAEAPEEQSNSTASVDLDLDFAFDEDAQELAPVPSALEYEEAPLAVESTDIPLEMSNNDEFGLDFESSEVTPLAPIGESRPPTLTDADALDFDLGGLSLDLETSKPEPTPSQANVEIPDDPLETKLALAEEFNSIGDEDGARALIEEVISESTGDMRAKAQLALSKLG